MVARYANIVEHESDSKESHPSGDLVRFNVPIPTGERRRPRPLAKSFARATPRIPEDRRPDYALPGLSAADAFDNRDRQRLRGYATSEAMLALQTLHSKCIQPLLVGIGFLEGFEDVLEIEIGWDGTFGAETFLLTAVIDEDRGIPAWERIKDQYYQLLDELTFHFPEEILLTVRFA